MVPATSKGVLKPVLFKRVWDCMYKTKTDSSSNRVFTEFCQRNPLTYPRKLVPRFVRFRLLVKPRYVIVI
jgi:hypothetical protein